MRKLRVIVGGLVGLAALWLLGLVIASAALVGRTRDGVAGRLGEATQGTVAIDALSLGLVRGTLEMTGLSVRRDDVIGHLAISVRDVTCGLPPLGGALWDRQCRELALQGVRLELSTAALFQFPRRTHAPVHARRVVLDDARLELAASALAPSLGRVVVTIGHAEAGDTVFKTPVSWVFSLRTFDAVVELPAGVTMKLRYANGQLWLEGGMFGATPLALPVALPVADAADDARAELGKLMTFGREVAQRVVAMRAAAWIKDKLLP